MADLKFCENLLDPELYSKKPLPLQSVKYFISEKLPQLGWGRTKEGEIVLDVGCGPGGTTLELILPLLSHVKKIFATDMLPNMIEFARNHNSHSLIEYSVANIENWSTVERWEGQISKLTTIQCVHWLKDKRRGFQNMFKLLQPQGEIAFCFVMETPVYDSIMALKSNPKWSKFFEDADDFVSDDHINKYESSRYIKMLEEIGFDILYIADDVKTDPFPSDEEFRDFFASVCALTSYVPSHQREEFKDDLFQDLLKRMGRDSSGRPVHKGKIIEGVARKRDTE